MGLSDNISSAYSSAKTAVTQTAENLKKGANTPYNQFTPKGRAGSLETSKYSIDNHSYPNDLMAADGRYGGNYVMFYINVASDPKLLAKHGYGEDSFVKDYPPRIRDQISSMGMEKENLVGSAATVTAVEAALAGGIAAGAKAAVVSAVGGAAVAAVGVGVVSSMAPDAKRSQKRLKTAIALHVPNQLSVRYGVQWSEDDVSALAIANMAGADIIKALQEDKKIDVAGLKADAAAAVGHWQLTKGPQAAGTSAATGLAANPMKQQIFKGVDYRTFSFDYQFFPRDIDEAKNVLRIIDEFKFHMHPDFKDTNNFIYVYPSEFDITYFTNGQENMQLHRHTSCVLTDMTVNYTPNGMFTTFSNGMPTQINMTLNFREIALLSKDMIKNGL